MSANTIASTLALLKKKREPSLDVSNKHSDRRKWTGRCPALCLHCPLLLTLTSCQKLLTAALTVKRTCTDFASKQYFCFFINAAFELDGELIHFLMRPLEVRLCTSQQELPPSTQRLVCGHLLLISHLLYPLHITLLARRSHFLPK